MNFSILISDPGTFKPVFFTAVLDYVNMTLPHVNSDDPIGFLVQFMATIQENVSLLHSTALALNAI